MRRKTNYTNDKYFQGFLMVGMCMYCKDSDMINYIV